MVPAIFGKKRVSLSSLPLPLFLGVALRCATLAFWFSHTCMVCNLPTSSGLRTNCAHGNPVRVRPLSIIQSGQVAS